MLYCSILVYHVLGFLFLCLLVILSLSFMYITCNAIGYFGAFLCLLQPSLFH